MDDIPEEPEWVAVAHRRRQQAPKAAFAGSGWVAARLGISPDTFRRKRPKLVRAGFPEPDPILNRYVKADVEAWIASRHKLGDADDKGGEVNWAAV